jgi:CDGSH-type Zn-finger protein
MSKNKNEECKVVVTKNGPYLVSGSLPLAKELIVCDKEGIPIKWAKGDKYPAQKTYSLCRCGKSKNHSYCDGTHVPVGFKDGTESPKKQ